MTEHKHFKRRVRERMARTGETYSTALRHVTAGDPARVHFVSPGRARSGAGSHHESALLGRVLARAGIELSDPMLAGLGGGIGFMYFVFEYEGHHPMVTVVAQAHPEPMIPLALARAGVAHEVRRTGSAKVAERNLRETLSQGRAAICRVGRFALPWRPGFPFPDPLEVAVIGLDGDVVLVDDRCVEPQELPLSDFMAAWSSVGKSRHHLISVTGDGPDADLSGAARASIADTMAKLTGPVLGNVFDVNFGLSGMRKLAAQLGDLRSKQGWARRFADPEAFFHGMTRLHECLEAQYGAPGAMRPLYADFLDEAADVVPGLPGEAATLYREAGRAWSALAGAAIDEAGIPADYRRIAAERDELLRTSGVRGAARLRELHEQAAKLPERYAAADPLGPAGRTEVLSRLAERAEHAVRLEERAVASLAEIRP
ncbi:BtrH N-terminal domain-containing protein [Sphaerisporangium perillae]|uniref:BtrH N-terminal domain-containing protein n=1 Tax=Sphaerisporangium perillae TaxID=2935860 RepID=UPI00200EBA46|nr:BtrH N-terminal domain-containing protein [Sphaerisporangium perillae]